MQKALSRQRVRRADAEEMPRAAYLRRVNVEKDQYWNSRGHFFATAAEAREIFAPDVNG